LFAAESTLAWRDIETFELKRSKDPGGPAGPLDFVAHTRDKREVRLPPNSHATVEGMTVSDLADYFEVWRIWAGDSEDPPS